MMVLHIHLFHKWPRLVYKSRWFDLWTNVWASERTNERFHNDNIAHPYRSLKDSSRMHTTNKNKKSKCTHFWINARLKCAECCESIRNGMMNTNRVNMVKILISKFRPRFYRKCLLMIPRHMCAAEEKNIHFDQEKIKRVSKNSIWKLKQSFRECESLRK